MSLLVDASWTPLDFLIPSAAAGAALAVMLFLTAVFAGLRYYQGLNWAAGVAMGCAGLATAFVRPLLPSIPHAWVPVALGGVALGAGHLAMTQGLWKLQHPDRRLPTSVVIAAGLVLAAGTAATGAGWLSETGSYLFYVPVWFGWAALFTRDPTEDEGLGPGFCVAACISYPVIVLARVIELWPVVTEVPELLPTIGLGLAVLTTGLARAHRASADALASLTRRTHEYEQLVEMAPEGVLVADETGRILLVNRALENLFGYARHELVGQPVEKLIPHHARSRHQHHRIRWASDLTPQPMLNRRGLQGLCADGHFIDIDVAIGVAGMVGGGRYTAIVTDMTQQRAQERELHRRATTDHLTGLVNREQAHERLDAILAEAGEASWVVALVDIDRFREVNESRGPDAANGVLRSVARGLEHLIECGGFAARMAGDDFLVAVKWPSDGVDALASRLVALPIALDTGTTLGVGLLVVNERFTSVKDLLAAAELALISAKASGRGQWAVYTQAMGDAAARERRVHQRLRAALDESRLTVHYQPQVRLSDGSPVGWEALVRWTDSELGAVSPSEFVPIAERTGISGLLGKAVLDTVCDQLVRWGAVGIQRRVSINLSPRQFAHADLAETIVEAMRSRGLPPSTLAVEITEGAVMEDPVAATAILRTLAAHGIEVHLDDFGVGHSSLAWLRSFPVSAIKVDRSFVADVDRAHGSAVIIRAVVAMAHELGCRVLAEGVETPDQRDHLIALGCDEGQGWLFGAPTAMGDCQSDVDARMGNPV